MGSSVLAPVQERGRAALEHLGLPNRREESWRLTDLKRLAAVSALPASASKPLSTSLPPSLEGVTRLVLNGFDDPLAGQVLPEGITVLNADELKQALGHTLDRCGCAQAWPVEFNHAKAQQILALRVRGRVGSLELVLAAGAGLNATRVLLLLEEKAELELMQVLLAEGASAHSHVLEVHLGQEAQLRHGVLATADGASSLMAHLAVEQEPRSSYALTSGGSGLELWTGGAPGGAGGWTGSRPCLKGLAVTGAEQQLATHTAVRFDGPEGELDQLQKCLAGGQSHAIFNGAISVPRDAQRTNAAQLSRNLLLSDRARVDTKPELEIVADDVRCAHGATVSQLQDDQLFYLQSRGHRRGGCDRAAAARGLPGGDRSASCCCAGLASPGARDGAALPHDDHRKSTI